MEYGGLLLCSLVPGPGPCPEPDESFSCHPVVFFNIILILSYQCLGFLFRLTTVWPKHTMHLSFLVCIYMSYPFHSSWFDHHINIWLVQIAGACNYSISTKDGQGNYKNNMDCRTKVDRARFRWLKEAGVVLKDKWKSTNYEVSQYTTFSSPCLYFSPLT